MINNTLESEWVGVNLNQLHGILQKIIQNQFNSLMNHFKDCGMVQYSINIHIVFI